MNITRRKSILPLCLVCCIGLFCASVSLATTDTLLKVSNTQSAYGSNHTQVCVNEFGSEWEEADWIDLEKYSSDGGNMSDLIVSSGFDTRTNAWVRRNGDQSYSSSRDYFASYHNHSKPSGYLAHDNIDNYFLSLGSWYGSYYVLCKNSDTSQTTSEPVVTIPEPQPSNTLFKVSNTQSAYGSNHTQVCVNEFGSEWEEADWIDLEKYSSDGGNMSDLIVSSGFDTRTNAWVRRNGDQSYSSSRDYFASYHNHSKPSGYLAHDNIDNYFLSLGSWYGSYYVLCKNSDTSQTTSEPAVTIPEPQTPASPPESPTLNVSTNSTTLNLSWNDVSGATDYTLYYAPFPYEREHTIGQIDMGTNTSFSATLWDGASYYVTITSTNNAGESGYSNVELFTIFDTPLDSENIVDTDYSWIIPFDDTDNSTFAENLWAIGNFASNAASSIALSYFDHAVLSAVTTYASFIIDEVKLVGGTHSTRIIVLDNNGVVDNDNLNSGDEYSIICISQPSSGMELPQNLYINETPVQIAPYMSSPFMGELIIPKRTFSFDYAGEYEISCGESSFWRNQIEATTITVH